MCSLWTCWSAPGRRHNLVIAVGLGLGVLGFCAGCQKESTVERAKPHATGQKLSHDETLQWIREHRAWRHTRKTKPIWVREVEPEEIGKRFMTADHAEEVAREGYWLCVGVAGEPWFQKPTKVEDKYEPSGEEVKRFLFDTAERSYRRFEPKAGIRNWAAQVQAPDVEGFFIRPSYDMQHPLYSPSGGYVVTGDVDDPYTAKFDDVWLVQQPLFESTYEIER
jgi:hypothetical protein